VDTKQIVAILAPLILLAMMYLIFRALGRAFGTAKWRVAWYLGLAIYWLIWGAVFPWLMLGSESILRIIQPQHLSLKIFFLVLFPIVISAFYKLVPNMKYEKPSPWIFVLLLSTCFGNGFFEELLWRGVYLKLFPNSLVFGLIWPSIFFALWHYIPGSMNPDGNVAALMVGAGFMGVYLGFLAKYTGTIWWTILMHTLGGLIVVL
jgi:membrane protease YdiL (CAAX protease family)